MIYPIKQVYITQYFGLNPHIYKQFGLKGHNGLDFRTKFKSNMYSGKEPLYAPESGVISKTGNQGKGGYGRYVRLRSGSYEHVLGHFHELKVRKGQKVKQGQLIGISDNTGFSSAPHLHWGVRKIKSGRIVNYNNGYFGYFNHLSLIKEPMESISNADIRILIQKILGKKNPTKADVSYWKGRYTKVGIKTFFTSAQWKEMDYKLNNFQDLVDKNGKLKTDLKVCKTTTQKDLSGYTLSVILKEAWKRITS